MHACAYEFNPIGNKVTVKTEKPANAGVQSSSPSKQALRHQNEAAAREGMETIYIRKITEGSLSLHSVDQCTTI